MHDYTNAICNICHSVEIQPLALLKSEVDGRNYSALKCKACNLIFSYPIPEFSFNALQKIYNQTYTDGQREIGTSTAAQLALREALNRQMKIVEKYVQPGKALNVGATNNVILELENRGWDLSVIDVSRYAVETACQTWGMDAELSRIEDYKAQDESFDFVKLGHVIEHLIDPKIAIQNICRMLKPGGVLLIDTDNAHGLKTQIEVWIRWIFGEQNAARWVRKLTGKNLQKRYGRLTPPEHLYCFSAANLMKLVEDEGFQVRELFKPAWGDLTWFPLTSQDSFTMVEKLFIKIDQVGARLGMGDVIAVLAVKL